MQLPVEDLAADLEQRGYRIKREAPLGDERVDLIAERDGLRRAYEVKAHSRLGETTQEVERLRTAALQAGLDGFSVVVATPPHTVQVTIENLRTELLNYVARHESSGTQEALASVTAFDDIVDIVIESVALHPSRIHVRGHAYVDVRVDDGRGSADGEDFAIDTLPFTFDVDLDADLRIVRMNELSVYARTLPA